MALPTRQYYRISVSAFYFIMGLVFASWASRIPDIKNALGLNDAQFGGVLFSIPMGQMCALAMSGYLVSRLGSRRMLTFAAVCYPAALILIGASSSVFGLSVALFLFGMSANMCNISVNTQAVGVERLYDRSIMATFHGLWSLAGFTGGVISTVMVAHSVVPLYHFIGVAVVTSTILLVMRNYMLPRDAKQPERERKRGFVKPDRYIVVLGLIAFISMMCEGTMFDWSGIYFEDVVRPPKELVRLGYVAFMATMACGRFAADRLITRFGAIPIIKVSGLVIFTGLMISAIFPYIVTATAGFLLVGFGVSSMVPIAYSLAGRTKVMHPGVAIATVSSIGFLGFLIGPPIIGFVSQALNLRVSFAIIAVVALATTVAAPLLDKETKNLN